MKNEKKLLDDSFKWHKSELGNGKGVTPDDLDLKKYSTSGIKSNKN